MILVQTWRVFRRHWRGLVTCTLPGYFALLPLTALLGGLGGLAAMDLAAGGPGGAGLLSAALRLLFASAVALPLLLGVGALVSGITLAGVVSARERRPVRLERCVRLAVRCWPALVAVQAMGQITLACVGIAVAMVLAPVPALAAGALWSAGCVLAPAFGHYAPYLIVADGLRPWPAWRTAWQGLRRRLADHLWAGLLLSGLAAAVNLGAGALEMIPLAGGSLAVLCKVVAGPFHVLYMAHRFERRIRPALAGGADMCAGPRG